MHCCCCCGSGHSLWRWIGNGGDFTAPSDSPLPIGHSRTAAAVYIGPTARMLHSLGVAGRRALVCYSQLYSTYGQGTVGRVAAAVALLTSAPYISIDVTWLRMYGPLPLLCPFPFLPAKEKKRKEKKKGAAAVVQSALCHLNLMDAIQTQLYNPPPPIHSMYALLDILVRTYADGNTLR